MPVFFTPSDLSRRFSEIMAGLQTMIAARGGRDRVFALIVPLLWNYLGRAARRFEALAKRVEAGRAAPRPRAPRPNAPDPEPSESREPRPRKPQIFPTGHAWLVRLAQETSVSGAQLRFLFAEPAFTDFLDAAPQVVRLLRPVCEMLGILREPDLPAPLLRPPAPPRSRPARERNADPSPASERPSPRRRPLAHRYRLTFKTA